MRNTDWFFGLMFGDRDGVADLGSGVGFIVLLIFVIWLITAILNHMVILWFFGFVLSVPFQLKFLDNYYYRNLK